MAKRGRPTAAATHGSESISASVKNAYGDKTTRTQAAAYYRAAVSGLLSEAASEIPYLDGIFHMDDEKKTCFQKHEIIEQLGRMLKQEGYSREEVLHVATYAAQYYHDGYTVKEIKAWLLKVRKEWKP